MAAPTGPASAPVLSQKQRRATLRKERRKRKRQALAQSRENELNDEPCQLPDEDGEENQQDEVVNKERQRLHEEWLQRERVAQEEFRQKTEREEAAQRRREEEERLIKEEWEARQKKEQEEQEQKVQKKRDQEEAVQKMLDEAENQLENGGPWMNPEAPVKDYRTERDVANCPFFLKTGACRFGDRCSRRHIYPSSSTTLLIRSMFFTFGMEQAKRDDYDMDACLEHSEEELHEHFIDFYHDVLPEFRSVGKVVQFKVSCNYESHLRGNVYVQFETEEQCKDALIKFNGRWYAGRQLHCELCPVTRWKNAICGLFDRQKCPKGKNCNFLHVFRNPGNEFWEADRDMSPLRRSGQRESWHLERRRLRSPAWSERSFRGVRRGEERGRYSERYHRERSRSRSRDGGSRRRSRDRSRDRTKFGRDKESRSKSRERARHKRKSSPKEDDSPHSRHKHSKKTKKKSKKKHKKKSKESPESKSTSEDSDKESTKGKSPKSEEKVSESVTEREEIQEKTLESTVKEEEDNGEALENDKRTEQLEVSKYQAISFFLRDTQILP